MKKVACLAVLLSLCACAHLDEQWFFVRDASVQQLSKHQQLSNALATNKVRSLGYDDKEFVVTGHRLTGGDDVVLAFRSFSSGSLIADTASFVKLTALIPQSRFAPGSEIKIPGADGAMAYYSSSSSNFPGAGGCFGYASQGTMKVDGASGQSVTVSIDLHFNLASPLGYSDQCGEKKIQGKYIVQQLPLRELSPWQGTAGKTLYEETIAP